ncbi:MAG: hypothetical protein RMY33_035530 [Nostoc sp. DedQUE03]
MKNNFALFQNPCRDVAIASLYIQIHTSIQEHLYFLDVAEKAG